MVSQHSPVAVLKKGFLLAERLFKATGNALLRPVCSILCGLVYSFLKFFLFGLLCLPEIPCPSLMKERWGCFRGEADKTGMCPLVPAVTLALSLSCACFPFPAQGIIEGTHCLTFPRLRYRLSRTTGIGCLIPQFMAWFLDIKGVDNAGSDWPFLLV